MVLILEHAGGPARNVFGAGHILPEFLETIVLPCYIIRANYLIRISKGCNFNWENELKFEMN